MLSHNKILVDIAKEPPISQKTSFVAVEARKPLKVYTYPEVNLLESSSDRKSNFPVQKEYQLIARTHKHIIPHSLKILEYMLDIRPKL